MRIVFKIIEIQRGRIIIFSKGCPSPLLAPSVSPPLLLLRRRRLPFTVDSRPAKGRPHLRLAPCSQPPCERRAASGCRPLRTAAPGGDSRPLRAGPSRNRSPTYGGGRGWPTLHGDWLWLVTPPPCYLRCGNTARTRRSYIPVFQIWIEKMKEVKRPPL
ncbi:hypothetical protein B296_00057727 [Ensete ventricosum]|uniref:Uncharacterized protein n=1 Tax=Ensete ventricosum TaxID=4639 RepID=A0A426WVX2_ENSVE|nr:hypothetical protein B296_00057727 [Ensete ventricosum]